MMRWLLAVLFAACCGHASAAAVPLSLPANVAAVGTSYVTSTSAAFSGAAFNSGLTTQIAGKAVTVPATWRLASNAGQVAVSAIRLNPAGLVTSAVATWLLGYGLQWVAGQWQKGSYPLKTGAEPRYPSEIPGWDGAPVMYQQGGTGAYHVYQLVNSPAHCGGSLPAGFVQVAAYYQKVSFPASSITCSWGVFGYFGYAEQPMQPVQESDWAAPSAATLPDAAATQLAGAKVALPLTPQVDTAQQVVPLSDPYVDPVTGKRYRDVAYVTPSAANPKTADVQVAKQEVDANGNPVVDPTTGDAKAPEETDDPCLAHPNRIGCMETGEVPAGPDLQRSEKTITITPDSGWGPETAACPADIVNTLRSGGGVVAYSFKAQCDFADGVRAPVIAIAWVVAVLIALGVGSRGGGE